MQKNCFTHRLNELDLTEETERVYPREALARNCWTWSTAWPTEGPPPEEDVWCLCSSSCTCQREREVVPRSRSLVIAVFSHPRGKFLGRELFPPREERRRLRSKERFVYVYVRISNNDHGGDGKIPMGWGRKVWEMGSHTYISAVGPTVGSLLCSAGQYNVFV